MKSWKDLPQEVCTKNKNKKQCNEKPTSIVTKEKCNDQTKEVADEESCYEKKIQQADGGSWCDKCTMKRMNARSLPW